MTEYLSFTVFSLSDKEVTVANLLSAAITFALFICIALLVRRAINRWVDRNEAASSSSFYTLARVAHYVLIMIGVLNAATIIGLDFSKLAIIAGALSVGIGFGLQTIFNNFISGIILLFDKSLKVGDFVELDASGVMGTVKEIRIRCTLLTTNDNVDILVPNSEFVSGRVVNWTYGDRLRRQAIPFGVSYNADPKMVIRAAQEAAATVSSFVSTDPFKQPAVLMTGFGESSLDFCMYAWVVPAKVKVPRSVASEFNLALHAALAKYDIEVPYPQRDLHIRSDHRQDGVRQTEMAQDNAAS